MTLKGDVPSVEELPAGFVYNKTFRGKADNQEYKSKTSNIENFEEDHISSEVDMNENFYASESQSDSEADRKLTQF